MKDHPEDHLAEEFGSFGHTDKIEWMIETNGWALEAVSPQPDTDPPLPGYAYSIGMRSAVDFPDVAVFGLQPVAAKGLVTLVADARRGGTEIPLDVEVVGLLDNDLRCRFAEIDLAQWSALFATSTSWFDGAPEPIVQLMYPDRNGFLPYESGYDQRMRFAQPVVGAV